MNAAPNVHEERVSPEYRVILWLAALGFFMQALDATIVNTALPAIAYSLHVDPMQTHDVVIAYVLTVAALIPVSGWLADRFGIKTVYLLAIVIFTLASLGCALAQTYNQLIVGRVFQGIGGAFLLPVARLALLRILPRNQFLAAMGFIGIPGLIGPMIGPTLGGFMVEYASWHWIFLINVPIGILGLIFTCTHMPNARLEHLPPFDYLGFILLVICMVALTLGLEGFSQGTWSIWQVFGVLSLGIVTGVIYVWHAIRDSRAIFRPELFRNVRFKVGIIGNAVTRLGSASMPFILPLTLQLALGFSPFQAGLMMIPLVFGSIVIKRFATQAISRYGYYRILSINTVLVGVGIMSFAALHLHPNVYTQSIHFFLFGCVNSMQFTAMNTVTLKDLNTAQAANGNSLLSMVMNSCMSMGVALVGVLLHYFEKIGIHHAPLWSFQWTYLVLGLMTVLASLVFRRLKYLKPTYPGQL
ncbi:DHA2 family efflux MFS transporter permease subunit [Acinetobacter qingfengensis]|uniref:EmrB/QacA subfamily drug resistance transporter n=1 Tax=Acinetobacter qingfengensis TaxID=1262585 RepID=A0A1E7RCZ4_9GAMM|nr:multidrug transporter subunit MdtD [Acinetobacter qingfengensis]KAA8732178.1 DHA2 family efflux MFS transporter permease subunit [Acinetobacter qingfengensis]OEY97163.1 EmrB/QacA subfamily drug resistance transporter [Acinetobacter qingfengensis]